MANAANGSDPAAQDTQPQPGAVIVPGTAVSPQIPVTNQSPAPEAPPKAVIPKPSETQAVPATETPQPPDPPLVDVDTAPDTTSSSDSDPESVTWTASEFVAHDKSAGWYAMLAVAAIMVAALVFFITKDKISVAVVIVAAILLGVYGAHKPRQLEYRIDSRGIGIGQKYHSFDEFRSFSVVPEGAFASVVFMPLKRFAPPLTVYFAPTDESKILSVLSDRLPFEDHKPDAVDRLVKHIRF